MVNEDEMMEVIDQIRFNLPDEIKQANWTVSEQQRIITEAHGEAARIMSRAKLEAHLGRTLATVRRGVEALQTNQPPAEENADQATGS